jgi:aspartyl protease family protein
MFPSFGGAAAVLLPLALFCQFAHAESVALAGMMGSKALLVVDGGTPKPVGAGDTYQGVKVISTSGDQAVVEQGGKRITLRVGEAPVSSGGGGGSGKGSRIVLTAGSGGHFMTLGTINSNASVQFMVDTGATSIAMGAAEADRAGIDYRKGQQILIGTANGNTRGYLIRLKSVRIGEVEVFDVEAVVSPASMPYVLLGNSFLGRFQMARDNDTMVLTRRY